MNQISANNVGVITFYKGQVDILRKRPKNMKYNGVRISCVDSFQGTEKDFIILSLVRTNKDGEFGFITNLNRINVSLTRAKKGIIVVGNFQALLKSNEFGTHPENGILIKLCKYFKSRNAVVDSSLFKGKRNFNEKNIFEAHQLKKLESKEEKNNEIEKDDEFQNIDFDIAFENITKMNQDESIESKFGDKISYN